MADHVAPPDICPHCKADSRYIERIGRLWVCACCAKVLSVADEEIRREKGHPLGTQAAKSARVVLLPPER